MVVLETLSLANLLIALATKKNLDTKTNSDGSVTVIDKDTGKAITTIPNIRQEDFAFLKFIPKRLTSSATAKPSEPTLGILNPQEADLLLLHMGFVPDAAFKTKGLLEVKINNVGLIDQTDAGLFTDLDTFSVPIPENGKKFRRNEKIEIRIWSSDGAAVSLTTGTLIGGFKK